MILSFGDALTEDLFHGNGNASLRRIPADIIKRITRKLDVLNAALVIEDLKSPPGNFLKALKGDRAGQYSIRVNDQWRITFRWDKTGPEGVRFEDYH